MDLRGDFEEPGMHVSEEHILALTVSKLSDHTSNLIGVEGRTRTKDESKNERDIK